MALVRWQKPLSFSRERLENMTHETSFRSTFLSDPDWCDLLFHYKCLTREELQGAMFVEYVKQEMIPRGLRMLKKPSLFSEDEAFVAKWNAILNKCSLDLMLLIIETTDKKIAETKDMISILKDELKFDYSSRSYKRHMKDLKDYIEQYRSNVRRRKIKKFRRDESDYKTGYVYPWMARKTKGPSKEYFDFTSEESDSSYDFSRRRSRPFFSAGRSTSQTRGRSSSNHRARQASENRWRCSWKEF